MKRKTFKGLLFRNLAISIVASVLIIVLVGILALKFALLIFEKNFLNEQNRLIKYYQQRYIASEQKNPEASEEELLNNTIDFIQSELAVGIDYSPLDCLLFSTSALYNQDTGELIADSSKVGWMQFENNETKYIQILFCHESRYADFLGMLYDIQYMPLAEFKVKDYYVKDNKKYLGKVEIYEDDKVKLVDFKPDSSEEYEHVTINADDYTFYWPDVWGYDKESEEFVKLKEWCEEGYWFNNASDSFTYELNGPVITGMGTRTFRLPDGTNLRIFDRANVDLYDDYGKWIKAFCIIVPVAALFVAVLAAYLKYIKLKAMYTMEDYRRTLTDSMAHDLKSPLMAISGYAENLKENINTDKKEHYAEAIMDNVVYMNDIISNILHLSKLEAGAIKLDKDKVELVELIRNNLDKYETALAENNIEIKTDNSVTVKGDSKLLSQAFDNLLSNAVKYSEPDSTIEIIAEDNVMAGVKKITITNVCNTQFGIDVSELSKPFVKGDNARSNKMGTGIGLTISQNIFKMHGFKQKLYCRDNRFVVEIQLN